MQFRKSVLTGMVFCAAFAAFSSGARADIAVDASKVLHARAPGIGGVVVNAHSDEFATNAGGIDFQGDLKAAKIRLVRHLAYPDARFPTLKDGKLKDVAWFDRTFKAIVDAGATPLFIQYIKPPEQLSPNIYLQADGTTGGTIQSNLVWMVKHFQAAPFNIKTQIWEIGNEPNHAIDYKATPEEYADIFNKCHQALIDAGLRDSVRLCGPVSIQNYRWPNVGKEDYIDYFLDHCKDSVDVVTFHNYGGGKTQASLLTAPHKLDFQFDFNRAFAVDAKTGGPKDYYGTAALQDKIIKAGLTRPNVGIGVTEFNANAFREEATGGLWNLITMHYFLYHPRGEFTTQFVFDDYGGQQGGYGPYNGKKEKRSLYWDLWIRGNLTGDKVLSQTLTPNADKTNIMKDGRPLLIVTASKDAANLYVEVINRDGKIIKDHVEIAGATGAGNPVIHVLADTAPSTGKDAPTVLLTPDKSTPSVLGTSFDYEFPALSATIFKFPLKAAK